MTILISVTAYIEEALTMGGLSEVYHEMNQQRKLRRYNRTVIAPSILTENNIIFTVHNGGAHIVIGKKIDFWPGTTRWYVRETKHTRFGIGKLIKFINKRGTK